MIPTIYTLLPKISKASTDKAKVEAQEKVEEIRAKNPIGKNMAMERRYEKDQTEMKF